MLLKEKYKISINKYRLSLSQIFKLDIRLHFTLNLNVGVKDIFSGNQVLNPGFLFSKGPTSIICISRTDI